MKKQLVILGILTLLVCVGLSGCFRLSPSYTTEKNKFVGTWTYLYPSGHGSNYSFTYQFFSNGNFSFHKPNLITNGTFDIIDGKLWLVTNTNGDNDYGKYSYVFSENNTKLTIEGTTYTKQ
ncbi:MAG: hypothetical protein MUO82_00680 [Candidatus Thermoplasmatota archaeon]|nr:hypothetical protein [Candidatus Thermoplasmatota archaeon]